MNYLNYNSLVNDTKNLSYKLFFIDGPRRCSTNYVRKCFEFLSDHDYLTFNAADETHTPNIYKKEGKTLHNKNILHIVPLRHPSHAIVSSLLMYAYNDLNLPFKKIYLTHEIFNFITYFKLEKKYNNVISVPIELFNDNEEKIFNIIKEKYKIKTVTNELDKNKLLRSFKSFDEYGENGLIKYHSYPIEEQKSEEYKRKRLFFKTFAYAHSKNMLDKLSKEYEDYLGVRKQEWGIGA